MSEPKLLRALLAGWRPGGERTPPGGEAGALAAAWPDAVGVDVARRTRSTTFRDGTLTVITPSSAWSHQLTFLAPTIIERLRERCTGIDVRRLKFVVATGRSRALLSSVSARARARAQDRGAASGIRAQEPGTTGTRGTTGVDDRSGAGDDLQSWLARLRNEQNRLDRRRKAEGWTRCAACGRWFEGAACAVCAEEKRRAADGRIAHALASAPWIGRSELLAQLPQAGARAYERVRRTLLTSWEQQLANARGRLRRGALEAADRVTAWSYAMMVARRPQDEISDAMLTDVLGREWSAALQQKAPRPPREKVTK